MAANVETTAIPAVPAIMYDEHEVDSMDRALQSLDKEISRLQDHRDYIIRKRNEITEPVK